MGLNRGTLVFLDKKMFFVSYNFFNTFHFFNLKYIYLTNILKIYIYYTSLNITPYFLHIGQDDDLYFSLHF